MKNVLAALLPRGRRPQWAFIISVSALLLSCHTNALAQGLNWEGQTGAFITPFAYPAPSSSKGFGRPVLAFHYLSGGPVLGNDFQTSVTFGILQRIEVGYTRSLNTVGSTFGLSPLFAGGYNTFHGKLNFLPENARKIPFVPALAAGFLVRSQLRRVGGVLQGKDTTNGDVYLVGTKTITQFKALPIVLNLGVKVTNASILGMAGNAPYWQGRMFGAAAVVVSGPVRSKLVLGSEFAQQPRSLENLPGARVPTMLTYFVRVLPGGEKHFNLDFGVAQAAGQILPGVDLKAKAQFALGVSYRL
jgi:hypothetical protein